MSNVRTQLQQGLRSELYEAFGNRPRLIKAFENLLYDVSTSIPTTADDNADDADSAITRTETAALRAEGIALEALAIARALDVAPPAQPLVLPDIPDDVTALVMQLLARVARLEQDLANLREGPTP